MYIYLGSVVRRVNRAIQRINPYPADKIYTKSIQCLTFIRWITFSNLFTTGPCSKTFASFIPSARRNTNETSSFTDLFLSSVD